MQNKVVIKLEEISKTYGEGRLAIRALDHVNLELEEGKIYTIMGPSGSGKSTLLNILGAMDSPSEGKALAEGTDITAIPEKELFKYRKNFIGFVFQDFHLIPNLDVIGNVLIPMVPYGIKEQDRKRAQEILDAVGLGNRTESKVNKLSGGQSQRVAIARALMNNPRVILADEPTGNLDSETGKAIVELLIKLTDQGTTIVIVTHDPRIAAAVSAHPKGKNIWIQDGRLSDKPTYNLACWDTPA